MLRHQAHSQSMAQALHTIVLSHKDGISFNITSHGKTKTPSGTAQQDAFMIKPGTNPLRRNSTLAELSEISLVRSQCPQILHQSAPFCASQHWPRMNRQRWNLWSKHFHQASTANNSRSKATRSAWAARSWPTSKNLSCQRQTKTSRQETPNSVEKNMKKSQGRLCEFPAWVLAQNHAQHLGNMYN